MKFLLILISALTLTACSSSPKHEEVVYVPTNAPAAIAAPGYSVLYVNEAHYYRGRPGPAQHYDARSREYRPGVTPRPVPVQRVAPAPGVTPRPVPVQRVAQAPVARQAPAPRAAAPVRQAPAPRGTGGGGGYSHHSH